MFYSDIPLVIFANLLHFLVVYNPHNLKFWFKIFTLEKWHKNVWQKKHNSSIPLQTHTNATLHKDTKYTYNDMKQIISRV